jgi:hypothetical protein
LDSLRRHQQRGITTEIFHAITGNSLMRARNFVTMSVAAPGAMRSPRTARPSLVNGAKSGRTGGIGDMTAGTVTIMIIGRGITDKELDDGRDLMSL